MCACITETAFVFYLLCLWLQLLYVSFFFSFLFLLFNIIKITNTMLYSVLISCETWQLLVL